MKLIKLFSIAATTLMAFASCSKEPVVSPQKEATADIKTTLTVTAGCETRAWLDASGSTNVMKWRTTDSLIVFDDELKGVALGTTAKNTPTATFTTAKWTGRTPKYAAAYCPNFNEAKVLTCQSEGVMSVKFRAVHTIDNLSSSSFQSSAMVGKVEENAGAYSISEMKNVMGFIGFSLSTAKVKTVTAESIGGEPMSGWVDVDYEKLVKGDKAFWTATSGKAQESLITLTPAPKGAANGGTEAAPLFKAGTYYFAVLPQTYAQGIKFTLYDGNNEVIGEQTVGTNGGVTVVRSQKLNISKSLDSVKLPDTVVIDLYFGSGTNPLGFTSPGAANESESGETYDYTYTYEDPDTHETKTTTFPVMVCRGTLEDSSAYGYRYLATTGTSYGNGTKVVQFHKCLSGWIKAPAIEGRYLQSITLSHGNTAAGNHMRIKTIPAATSSIAQMTLTKGGTTAPATMTVNFYTDGNDCNNTSMNANTTSINTAYYMIFAEKNQVIDRLTFTYTKSLPTR